MKRYLKKTAMLIVVLSMFTIVGCGATYYECPECGASYRQKWYQHGLPGQIAIRCKITTCRSSLMKVKKEDSKWDDSREPDF